MIELTSTHHDIRTSINKEVKALDSPHVGHIVRETDEKIVVFGHCDYRFDKPKSEIVAAGRNIIVGMDFPEILKYRVDSDAPLPTGERIDKLTEEEKNL
jgi:hypothetical protein